MSATDRLHSKYHVERMDGREKPGARYFVLDYANDPAAGAALRVYANEVRDAKPDLAADLDRIVGGEPPMSADTMPQVDGLHDLAEALEQTGIPLGPVTVNVHPADDADGERLADALGLTTRHDYTRAAGDHRDFTTWEGTTDGVTVTVFGATPKEEQA